MKTIKTLALLVLISTSLFGQNKSVVNIEGFNSVFQNVNSGEFPGTVNGVLIIKDLNNKKEVLLDFQGGKANLEVVEDEYKVYDTNQNIYKGQTTSGKTNIRYTTYFHAHEIEIQLNGKWFVASSIDGSCEMVIDGIKYFYKSEKDTEYLVLRITKEVELTTEYSESSPIEVIKLLPNSTLVFAISRNNK